MSFIQFFIHSITSHRNPARYQDFPAVVLLEAGKFPGHRTDRRPTETLFLEVPHQVTPLSNYKDKELINRT